MSQKLSKEKIFNFILFKMQIFSSDKNDAEYVHLRNLYEAASEYQKKLEYLPGIDIFNSFGINV